MLLIMFGTVFGLMLLKLVGAPIQLRHGMLNIGKKLWLWMMGIKVVVREGVPPREAGILMANHRSYVDVMFFKSATPQVYLSKIEVKSWPIIGWGAKALDVVFVDRSSKESRSASRAELAKRVSSGLSPVVFPEGTTVDRGLLEFNPGMFFTAAELGVPVIPFVIEYSDPRMAWVDNDTFISHLLKVLLRSPWTVDLYIGEPVRNSNGVELHRQIHDWMLRRVRQ